MNNVALKQAIGTTSLVAFVTMLPWSVVPADKYRFTDVAHEAALQPQGAYKLSFPALSAHAANYTVHFESVVSADADLAEFSRNFISRQKNLDVDFLNILEENSWVLYEKV